MNLKLYSALIMVIMAVSTSCSLFQSEPDVSHIDVNINIQRFEKDLFSIPFEDINKNIPVMRNKYPLFFELFNNYIINIGNSTTATYPDLLLKFLTHYTVQQAYKRVEEEYQDISFIEKGLSNAFKYYKYYFPDKIIPKVITYVGGFQQSIIVDDSMLVIGLDNYLGRECELYKRLGIQQYIVRNMHRDKIIPDCINSWLKTEFIYNDSIDNVLSQMIYQGKILYATSRLIPETPDSLIMGFTNDQMQFCKNYEKKMWTYLVEYKILFKNDRMIINKFINDGPYTNDFSRKSPARAVTWMGWQIVKKYSEKNNVSLYNLMKEDDYMKIFNNARYNP